MAGIAYIWWFGFHWAWIVHKVRTKLIAGRTLPTWNPAFMSFFLFTDITFSAGIAILTPVWNDSFGIKHLLVPMISNLFRNSIRRASNHQSDFHKVPFLPKTSLYFVPFFSGQMFSFFSVIKILRHIYLPSVRRIQPEYNMKHLFPVLGRKPDFLKSIKVFLLTVE